MWNTRDFTLFVLIDQLIRFNSGDTAFRSFFVTGVNNKGLTCYQYDPEAWKEGTAKPLVGKSISRVFWRDG